MHRQCRISKYQGGLADQREQNGENKGLASSPSCLIRAARVSFLTPDGTASPVGKGASRVEGSPAEEMSRGDAGELPGLRGRQAPGAGAPLSADGSPAGPG